MKAKRISKPDPRDGVYEVSPGAAGICVKAWNAYRRAKTVGTLKFTTAEAFPRIDDSEVDA